MRADTTLNANLWSGSPNNTNNSSSKFNDGEWHHLVITGIILVKMYI